MTLIDNLSGFIKRTFLVLSLAAIVGYVVPAILAMYNNVFTEDQIVKRLNTNNKCGHILTENASLNIQSFKNIDKHSGPGHIQILKRHLYNSGYILNVNVDKFIQEKQSNPTQNKTKQNKTKQNKTIRQKYARRFEIMRSPNRITTSAKEITAKAKRNARRSQFIFFQYIKVPFTSFGRLCTQCSAGYF